MTGSLVSALPVEPATPSALAPTMRPAGVVPGPGVGAARADAKLHKVAKQFEAVFLSEMLRLARPADKAAPGFSAGENGGTWQVFMDQALGEAAAANGGAGLSRQIEDALRRASGKGGMR